MYRSRIDKYKYESGDNKNNNRLENTNSNLAKRINIYIS
jgi:hypothetical protein